MNPLCVKFVVSSNWPHTEHFSKILVSQGNFCSFNSLPQRSDISEVFPELPRVISGCLPLDVYNTLGKSSLAVHMNLGDCSSVCLFAPRKHLQGKNENWNYYTVRGSAAFPITNHQLLCQCGALHVNCCILSCRSWPTPEEQCFLEFILNLDFLSRMILFSLMPMQKMLMLPTHSPHFRVYNPDLPLAVWILCTHFLLYW